MLRRGRPMTQYRKNPVLEIKAVPAMKTTHLFVCSPVPEPPQNKASKGFAGGNRLANAAGL
jgi:hypothetical protein